MALGFTPSSLAAGASIPNTYAAANDPSCTPATLACSNSSPYTLSCGGSTTIMGPCMYSSCVQECTLTANQGGGFLYGQPGQPAPGNTRTEFPTNAGACGMGNIMTCTGTATTNSLTCSTTGGTSLPISDCNYATCTPTGGSGTIYVADNGNNRVDEFTSAAAYNWEFSSNPPVPAINSPTGIAVDGSVGPTNGNVWVVNNGASTVDEYDSTGKYLSLQLSGVPGGFSQRQDLDNHSTTFSQWQDFDSLFISDAYAALCGNSCNGCSPVNCTCNLGTGCIPTCNLAVLVVLYLPVLALPLLVLLPVLAVIRVSHPAVVPPSPLAPPAPAYGASPSTTLTSTSM